MYQLVKLCFSFQNRAENKGRGDIIYADLQLPKTSNNGSMRLNKPALEKTNYAEIKFPVYEKADLQNEVSFTNLLFIKYHFNVAVNREQFNETQQ